MYINQKIELDPISRIDDTEIFCNNKWHNLSGKDYSIDFNIKLNLFYDTYLNELSPGRLYWGKKEDFGIIYENMERIAGKVIKDTNIVITRYGAELKIVDKYQCPEDFTMGNIYTDQTNSVSRSCFIICFSGDIMSDNPIIM